MLYGSLVVLLVLLVFGYVKREWLKERFKKKGAQSSEGDSNAPRRRPSALTKFFCRVGAALGNVGISIAIGLLCAAAAGLAFYFFVDKEVIIFPAGFAVFGFMAGGGLSWVYRNG